MAVERKITVLEGGVSALCTSSGQAALLTTTHRQMIEEQLLAAGISEELVRISVGLEHIDDILADIEQALSKL